MMKQTLEITLIAVFVLLGAACNPIAPAFQPGANGAGPQAWLDAPEDDSVHPLAPYKITAHASDLQGVTQIELAINGATLATIPYANSTERIVLAEQLWTPPGPGKYLLQVRAQNSVGQWGSYAGAEIEIQGTTARGPSPTPPPTRVATPTPPPSPTNLPNVTIRFNADDPSLTTGECTDLRWAVTNVSQVLLDNAAVTATSSKRVCPRQTTAYKLLITTLDRRNVEREVTITVTAPAATSVPTATRTRVISATVPPAAGCSGAPSIASFSASPTTITAGGSAALIWGAVTNADSVQINNGVGGVGTPGSTNVSPGSTTTYTLTASCKGTPTTRQVIITVNAAPAGPTLGAPTFSATGLMHSDSSACSPVRSLSTRVQITASDPQGVASVRMFYRYAASSGSPATAYSSVLMPLVGGPYSFTLNAPTFNAAPYTDGRVHFYFVATDGGGATTQSPNYNNNVSLLYCGKP